MLEHPDTGSMGIAKTDDITLPWVTSNLIRETYRSDKL